MEETFSQRTNTLVTVVTLKVIIAVTQAAEIDLLHSLLLDQRSLHKHCFWYDFQAAGGSTLRSNVARFSE